VKYGPAVGDIGVVGQVDFISRNPYGSSGVFIANVTANGYDSVAQNILDPQLRFCCPGIPVGLNNGDWVVADIGQGEYAPYAAITAAL
jgi:hypothetical protein